MRDAYRTHSAFFKLPVFFFLLFLFFSGTAGHAAGAAAPKNSTRIVSEKMTYDAKKNQVVFEGKVHVTRPTMEIWSEFLTVVMDDSGKKAASQNASNSAGALGVGGGKVDRIIAEKNVRIKQENKQGTSGKATYFVNEGRIVMEDNPIIMDGDNRISGKVITYYTETGRSLVTGAPDKPVEVLFSTDDSKGAPELPGVGVGAPPATTDAPAPAGKPTGTAGTTGARQ